MFQSHLTSHEALDDFKILVEETIKIIFLNFNLLSFWMVTQDGFQHVPLSQIVTLRPPTPCLRRKPVADGPQFGPCRTPEGTARVSETFRQEGPLLLCLGNVGRDCLRPVPSCADKMAHTPALILCSVPVLCTSSKLASQCDSLASKARKKSTLHLI